MRHRGVLQICCGWIQPVYGPRWRETMLCGGLRQVSSVIDQVLRETRGRENMRPSWLPEGCSRTHSILRSSWRRYSLQIGWMQSRRHWQVATLSSSRGWCEDEVEFQYDNQHCCHWVELNVICVEWPNFVQRAHSCYSVKLFKSSYT